MLTKSKYFVNSKLLSRALFSTSATTPDLKHTEVLIVGGGLTGTALACALSKSPYFEPSSNSKNITIIDASNRPSLDTYRKDPPRVPENRVITINPSTLRFLRSVGVLELCDQRYITHFHLYVFTIKFLG